MATVYTNQTKISRGTSQCSLSPFLLFPRCSSLLSSPLPSHLVHLLSSSLVSYHSLSTFLLLPSPCLFPSPSFPFIFFPHFPLFPSFLFYYQSFHLSPFFFSFLDPILLLSSLPLPFLLLHCLALSSLPL